MRIASFLVAVGLVVSLPAFAARGDAEAGKKKSETCVACHGVDGNSPSADFPKLAGQHADYLRVALTHYRNGKRNNAIMKGFAAGLTDRDIADLAAYFASQSGLQEKH